jgi:yecA family protein
MARRQAEAATVLPPNLHTIGALPFTQKEQAALQQWLGEGGWPPGTLDIHALEGYLVALLVWPVGLPSGAWLPPIWGERGWKVPAKLAGPLMLDKFVAMVSAFLQALDDRLYSFPVPYVPAIAAPARRRPGERPDSCSWATGFLGALQHHTHAQGLKYRSEAAKAAATAIAHCASLPPSSGTSAELGRAVYILAAERTSRGPLESLDSPTAKPSNPRRVRR